MADDNPLCGAEQILGKLGKLVIRVAQRTIQTYLRGHRALRGRRQTWATFLKSHAHGIWACDFLPVFDLFFRPLYAFFVIALGSRRVVQHPRYLIRDNDRRYGEALARVAAASGITAPGTAYRAPRQNATCKCSLGSVRRAWITPSSSASATCGVSCGATPCTSTTPGHSKVWCSGSPWSAVPPSRAWRGAALFERCQSRVAPPSCLCESRVAPRGWSSRPAQPPRTRIYFPRILADPYSQF